MAGVGWWENTNTIGRTGCLCLILFGHECRKFFADQNLFFKTLISRFTLIFDRLIEPKPVVRVIFHFEVPQLLEPPRLISTNFFLSTVVIKTNEKRPRLYSPVHGLQALIAMRVVDVRPPLRSPKCCRHHGLAPAFGLGIKRLVAYRAISDAWCADQGNVSWFSICFRRTR